MKKDPESLTWLPAALVAILAAVTFSGCGPDRSSRPVSGGAAPQSASREKPPLRVLPPLGDITLRGEYGARFGAAAANLLTRQDRYSLATYRSNATSTPGALWPDWPGDQLGRMLSVMHVAEGYGWTPARVLRKGVGDTVLPLQNVHGNFGPEKPFDDRDSRIVSGNAFALRGLVDAYEDTRDERYLAAASRLARYYEAAFDTWKDRRDGALHEFYGHCLDGLVRLYELGGDAGALDLAKRAASQAGRTPHTHHSLSMYRGVIDLARVTGDASLLGRAEDYLRWCRERRIASGGLPESMPASEEDEGCALADYVIVNLMMFRATGRDAYVEDAERTLVNHFFMNQFHTGGFGHRAYAVDVIGGKQWQGWEGRFGSENPGCCSIWGAWALGQAGRYIVTGGESGALEINLYPCADVDIPEYGARLEITSDFPRMSRARITVRCDQPLAFPLRLRVPAWAAGVSAKLNGKAVEAPAEGGRLVLAREWRSGDRVELTFGGGARLVPWPAADSGTAAVYDGPLCLGLSSAEADVQAIDRILVDREGRLALTANGKPQAADASGRAVSCLRPIGEDWLSPDVKNPNRLRILFKKQVR